MKWLKTQANKIRTSRRRGLTLIELVVVMSILIALAGLLIPMLPGMLTRAHTSTCSTNMGEVAKAIQEYQQLFGMYPNNMDALTNGTAMIGYLANGSSCPTQYLTGTGLVGGGQLIASALTANEVAALQAVGLTTAQSMVAPVPTTTGTGAQSNFDPSFFYYADQATTPTAATITGNALSLASGQTFAILDPTTGTGTPAQAICAKLGLPQTGRYLALGVGQRCAMVGKTMLSAPVHYGDVPVLNPEYGYERLVAFFKVSDTALTSFPEAQLVAVGPIHDDGIGSIGDETQNWYQISQ